MLHIIISIRNYKHVQVVGKGLSIYVCMCVCACVCKVNLKCVRASYTGPVCIYMQMHISSILLLIPFFNLNSHICVLLVSLDVHY